MDRMLGFDMQTIFSWVAQLINTGVLVFLLWYILYEPVKKFLDKRTKRIEDTISNAKEFFTKSEDMKKLYESKLRSIDNERLEIIESARKRAFEIESEIIKKAEQEANLLKERASTDIKLEQERVINDMKIQIINISTLVAEKYISQNIDENIQNKLLDEVISDLGDVTWLN